MSKKPESLLIAEIIKYVEDHGGVCWKNHGSIFSKRGIPDIVGHVHNKPFAVECKAGTNKPSEAQVWWLNKLSPAFITGTVYSLDEFRALFRRL